jgi:ferrous iron transport protein B
VARKRGIVIDAARLSQELGMPVVETVAVQHDGEKALLAPRRHAAAAGRAAKPLAAIDAVSVEETQREVRRILAAVSNDASDKGNLTRRSTTWCCTRSSARYPGRADVPDVPGRVQLGRRRWT